MASSPANVPLVHVCETRETRTLRGTCEHRGDIDEVVSPWEVYMFHMHCGRVDRTAIGFGVEDRSVYNYTTQYTTLPVYADIQAVYARARRAGILLISLSKFVPRKVV